MQTTLRLATLASVAGLSTAGYLWVATKVRKARTQPADRTARREIQRHASDSAKWLAETTGHIGKWYVHGPIAGASTLALALAGRRSAAVAIAASSLAATAASRILDRVHQHRTPPPGKTKIDPDAQSFPSGHALETTTVAIAGAYVAVAEHIARPAIAVPIAVVAAVVSGLGRLVLDRHWSTDSVAGYCAGVALGATCAAGYELARS